MAAEVNRFENASVDRDQLSREAELGLLQPRVHQHLGHVPVVQYGVRREIFSDLAEMVLQSRLAPRTGHPGFCVANDATLPVDQICPDQSSNRKISGRGITTRVRNQPGTAD